MTKRLKWTEVEEALLLNYVIEGIQTGVKIKDSISAFCELYNVPSSSVKSKWQTVAERNRLYIGVAKAVWGSKVKELEESNKAQKEAEKQLKKDRKERERYRKQMILKAKKAEKVKVSIKTSMKPNPTDSGLYIQVDANGVVRKVERLTTV